MCEASEHSAGYVLLIEDYTDGERGYTSKFAPVVFETESFTTGQMSLTI